MRKPTSTFLVSLALASVLGACGDDDDTQASVFDAAGPDAPAVIDAAVPDAAPPDARITGVTVACEGVAPGVDHHQYVLSAIDMPTNASQAQLFGIDLDGDPQGRPDNALGQILATLASQAGDDSQAAMDIAIAEGDVRQLVDIVAVDLAVDGAVTAQTYLGGDCDDPADPTDDFSGIEAFGPLPDALTDAVLSGAVAGGALRVVGVGPIEVKVTFLGGILVRLPLSGAIIEAVVTGGEVVSGKLGGAVRESDLDGVFIPAVADGLQGIVAAECSGTSPTCCPSGSTGETVVDLFDANDDCAISVDELRDSDLISSLLAPDVDLFDAKGNYNPRADGVKDGLSLGIGFTAVPAVVNLPASE